MQNTWNQKHARLYFFGMAVLLLLWQFAAMNVHEIVLASPYDTARALAHLFTEARFWSAIWATAQRMGAGVLLGGLAGFFLGVVAGLNEDIKHVLEPLRWMVMSISPIIVVVIAMLWFGMGTQMVIFIAAVLLSPLVYVNTVKGVEMVDETLVEMTQVYRFSPWQKLRHLYFPAIIGPLAAAMTIVVAAAMRMVVLAEVLGTNSGIGYELSFARTDLNTPELFAWVIVTLVFVGIAEFLLFKPLENHLLRWRKP